MADAEEKAKAEKLAAAKKRVCIHTGRLKPHFIPWASSIRMLTPFAGGSIEEKDAEENHNEEGREV